MEEHIYARRLVKKARAEGRHAGFYLFPEPKPSRGRGYIAANLLLTLFISLWLAFRVGRRRREFSCCRRCQSW